MPFLPLKDREYLETRGYLYEEKEHGGQKAIVLKNVSLPALKYNFPAVNVLILLPGGYPDTPPDMFFTDPWVKLVAANRVPRAADQPFDFAEIKWQRWSRHSSEWRAGRDGIWTMIKRIEHAIEIAE